jgi:RimJ/RimL family protein N-acetyltransferase
MKKLLKDKNMIEIVPIDLDYDFEAIVDEFMKQLVRDTLEYYRKIGFMIPWISYIAKDKGNYVGICSFKGKPINNKVEIAYCTNPKYENNGYATEMCKELINIVHNECKKIIITARTLPEINASAKVLKKNGFVNNGIIIDPDDGEVFEWILNE